VLAVSVCDAAAGDTATLVDTLVAAAENLATVKDDERVADKLADDWMSEAVLDKGYHSRQTLLDLQEMNVRSYASEPERRRQKWDGRADAREAVYANRRRIRGGRGKASCGAGGRSWNAPSPTATRPAGCGGSTCVAGEHRQAGAGPRRRVQHGAADATEVRPSEAAELLRGGLRADLRADGVAGVDARSGTTDQTDRVAPTSC
jgi:hypothetical protein